MRWDELTTWLRCRLRWPWIEAPRQRLARWFFLRALGAIYLIAFVSLWSQIDGLLGARGILPVGRFLEMVRAHLGAERYWLVPTLCWLDAGDAFLSGLCAAGSCLSLLLLLDVAPALSSLGCWALYLSLVSVGQEFLSFQWDALLLESGLLAVFLSPLRLWPRRPSDDEPPSVPILWLFRWLLFRLTLSSGIVKLASGDLAWRGLTALTRHFETQPLPTWIGWYVHQLPVSAHRFSCLMVFLIEGLVPFFIFGPRRWRLRACALLVGFQVLIFLTGNYCFFNLLTLALCLFLLDDDVWPGRVRTMLLGESSPRPGVRWPDWITAPFTALTLVVTAVQLSWLPRMPVPWPAPVLALERAVAPWRSLNSYGLFAVMTMTRPEIVIEGSQDGSSWQAYEFRDKPGDLARRPRFVEPHQPRLDWQMWFAALGTYRENRWFLEFCARLLEGSPPVLALLAHNPFPDHPPRYLRAVLYEYHFTDWKTRREQGTWWRRDAKGLYCPLLSLKQPADQ